MGLNFLLLINGMADDHVALDLRNYMLAVASSRVPTKHIVRYADDGAACPELHIISQGNRRGRELDWTFYFDKGQGGEIDLLDRGLMNPLDYLPLATKIGEPYFLTLNSRRELSDGTHNLVIVQFSPEAVKYDHLLLNNERREVSKLLPDGEIEVPRSKHPALAEDMIRKMVELWSRDGF